VFSSTLVKVILVPETLLPEESWIDPTMLPNVDWAATGRQLRSNINSVVELRQFIIFLTPCSVGRVICDFARHIAGQDYHAF
jgi:hypothetical protein